jgi:hypothetical protein
MSDLTPELKSLLARLCVADSTSSSFSSVYEERAFIRELVAVVGAADAFKALAKHINSYTHQTTYNTATQTAVYPSQDYTDFNGSDVLLNIGTSTLTIGQETALAMLIRANISLQEMMNVISYANLLAYIALRAGTATTAAATTKPVVEADTDADFSTKLHASRAYQYDISQFFNASGVSSFKFASGVSNDDIMFILYKSAIYNSAGDNKPNVFLKMITEVTGANHPLRSDTKIGAGFKPITAVATGFILAGPNYTSYTGVQFTKVTVAQIPATSTNVITYVNTGSSIPVTLLNTVDTYYLSVPSIVFRLNFYSVSNNVTSHTVNGDSIISAESLKAYTVETLLGLGLTTLNIKQLDVKTLPEIIAGYNNYYKGTTSRYTPTLALTDGWDVTAVQKSYPNFVDLTQSGTIFNALSVVPSGTSVPKNIILVDLTTPDLIAGFKAMYNAIPANPSNVWVEKISQATTQLPGYISTQSNSTWSTANNLTASVARWIYTSTNTSMEANHLVGKMSIAVLKTLLSGTGLSDIDIVKQSEFALYADGAITSGLSPAALIASPYNLTAKAAISNNWPVPLIMNSFPVSALLGKTNANGVASDQGTPAITIPQALLGREWAVDSNGVITPSAANNKSVDNIPFKTLVKFFSEEDILGAIRGMMYAPGNGLTSGTSGNIVTFLSALHLPFAVVKRLIGAQYGPSNNPLTVSKANIAALKNYTKSQRRSVYKDITDAITSLTRDELSTDDFVALGWPVTEWQEYVANPNGVTITISLRELLGAFEKISVFDPESFVIYGANTETPTDQRAIYHTKEERVALVRLFTTQPGKPPLPEAEITRLALGPLEDLDEITL